MKATKTFTLCCLECGKAFDFLCRLPVQEEELRWNAAESHAIKDNCDVNKIPEQNEHVVIAGVK